MMISKPHENADSNVQFKKTPIWSRISYNEDPDYSKPLLEIPPEIKERLLARLRFLYGEEKARKSMPELERILKVHHAHKPMDLIEAEKSIDPENRFTQRDMVLITYGDMVAGEGLTPLAVLHNFIATANQGAINTIHLLPFFPYSSDRGFSVVDHTRVDPKLGTWDDIRRLGLDYALMFDGVLNHVSSRSRLFSRFLNGNPAYQNVFIAYDSPNDLTSDQRCKIFRPRTSDILSRFDTLNGPKYLWTTFSKDQIDLNFRNPFVLLRVIHALLMYIRNGADIVRLDAVTYIWAEPGTECVHLPQTHEIIKLLRDVIDLVAPGVALLTETNVPHEDNISYFGNGSDEAHMVYNFALPPMVLYAFYSGDATELTKWARTIKNPSGAATFFNFLDSHDGIGLMGVKKILSQEQIDMLVRKAKENGALISYKMTESKTEEPYEINSTWWSAVNSDRNDEIMDLQIKRYLASRSIALVIQGVPAVYAHGAIGTGNDHELARQTGINRDINRARIDIACVIESFKDKHSKLGNLARKASKLYLTRTHESAFHPQGEQKILNLSPHVFAVLRTSPEGNQQVLTMTNVANRPVSVDIDSAQIGFVATHCHDLITKKERVLSSGTLSLTLEPYGIAWLKISGDTLPN